MDFLSNLQAYSFLLALLLIAGLIVAQTWRGRRVRWVGLGAALLIVAGWWFLRPGASGSAAPTDVDSALAAGRPVVVELYSDY